MEEKKANTDDGDKNKPEKCCFIDRKCNSAEKNNTTKQNRPKKKMNKETMQIPESQ